MPLIVMVNFSDSLFSKRVTRIVPIVFKYSSIQIQYTLNRLGDPTIPLKLEGHQLPTYCESQWPGSSHLSWPICNIWHDSSSLIYFTWLPEQVLSWVLLVSFYLTGHSFSAFFACFSSSHWLLKFLPSLTCQQILLLLSTKHTQNLTISHHLHRDFGQNSNYHFSLRFFPVQ